MVWSWRVPPPIGLYGLVHPTAIELAQQTAQIGCSASKIETLTTCVRNVLCIVQVFLTGEEEIEDACKKITKECGQAGELVGHFFALGAQGHLPNKWTILAACAVWDSDPLLTSMWFNSCAL